VFLLKLNRSSAGQEIPCVLWNATVLCHNHKCPPLVLSWARTIQSTPPHPTYLWNVSSHYKFLSWGVVSTLPNIQAGGPPFVTCLQLLIQCICRYTPYLEAFAPTTTRGRAMLWQQGHTHHDFFRFCSYKMCKPLHLNIKLFRDGSRDWNPTTGIKDNLKSVKTAVFWDVMPRTQLVLPWPQSITSHKAAVFAVSSCQNYKMKLENWSQEHKEVVCPKAKGYRITFEAPDIRKIVSLAGLIQILTLCHAVSSSPLWAIRSNHTGNNQTQQ
jgi:hypothetical protein